MAAGNGGASFWGSGAIGPTLNAAGGAAGVNATTPGSGGSGAILSNSTTGLIGGTGAAGEILIVEYLAL
jgi:hypothetical protein